MNTSTPHDGLFKRIFKNPLHAAGILRSVLPAELVAQLDFSTLELEPSSFIDQHLAERHTDLLFRMRLGGQHILFALLEHQSTSPHLMAFRMLAYLVWRWESWLKKNPSATTLPLIIPIVISHAKTGWTVTTQVADLIDLPAELRVCLAPIIPTMRFVLDDLTQRQDTELKTRPMTAIGRVALFALKNGRDSDDLTEGLVDWAPVLSAAIEDGNAEALTTIIRYLLTVNETIEVEPLIKRLAPVLGRNMETVLMTAGDRLRAEGKAEGLAEGKAEGKAEGLAEGRARALLTQIKLKFGTDDPAITERIYTADNETLDRWIIGVLSAKTLEALFETPSNG